MTPRLFPSFRAGLFADSTQNTQASLTQTPQISSVIGLKLNRREETRVAPLLPVLIETRKIYKHGAQEGQRCVGCVGSCWAIMVSFRNLKACCWFKTSTKPRRHRVRRGDPLERRGVWLGLHFDTNMDGRIIAADGPAPWRSV